MDSLGGGKTSSGLRGFPQVQREGPKQQWGASSGVSGHSNRSHDCQLFKARAGVSEWSRPYVFTQKIGANAKNAFPSPQSPAGKR